MFNTLKQQASSYSTKALALSLLALLGIIWGSGYVIAKLATTHGVPPLGYSFWQSLGPAILIGLLTLMRGTPPSLSNKHIKYYGICGLIGIALPNSVMYFTASHLPAGLLAVIVNIAPIATYVIALAVKQEWLERWRLAGVCCGALGIMLIILPQASLPNSTQLPWALLTLIAPVAFAACAVYIAAQQTTTTSDSLTQAAGMLLASAILLTPIVIGTDNLYRLHYPLSYGDKLILLEILLSSCGYVVMFKLLQLAGPAYYSLVSGVVMITGLAWGYWVFDETLSVTAMIAIALILLAITLVSLRQTTRHRQNLVAAKPQTK